MISDPEDIEGWVKVLSMLSIIALIDDLEGPLAVVGLMMLAQSKGVF